MTTPAVYAGIDIAKETLDVGSSERVLFQARNATAGHDQVVKRLREAGVTNVVVESTGIYGKELVRALIQAGFGVAVVQAGRARHFARSINALAKTDQIDAMMLARFGEATSPRLHQLPSTAVEQLRALSERRRQIIEDRVREQNRLEACLDPHITKGLRASIARLEKAEKSLDTKIAHAIDVDHVFAAARDTLCAESGVGIQTATILITRLPELGEVNRQQIAALAGLAPYDQSSGTWKGKRAIYGGRADVRQALYLAALSAVRWNPTIKDVYQRLLKNGKDKKLALIACARKLLVRLNSLMTAAANQRHSAQLAAMENHA
jgi:transposase